MLRVFESNKVDRLFSAFTQRIRESQQELLHPKQIVITCFGVEQWLLKSLTNEFGVFLNGQFDFPINFVRRLATLLAIETDEGYQIEALKLRFFTLLHEQSIAHQIEELDSTLHSYLYPDASALKEKRLWQTADSLAIIFDDYQWQRVEWLYQWQQNKPIHINDSLSVSASIQALLWRALCVQQQSNVRSLPRHLSIQKIVRALEQDKALEALSCFKNGIAIWSITPLMPPIWKVIQALAKHIEIDFYFLNPSTELWGENLYLPLVEARLKKNQENSDTEALFYQHNPLLMAMGQVGAQCQKQLLDVPEIISESVFESPEPDALKGSLLARVHHDVFYNIPEPEIEPIKLSGNDNSLQIYGCQNRVTELKKLHRDIIQWLQEDNTRHYDDILILSPDINHYLDWIPIIFSNTPYTSPHINNQDNATEAFSFFLKLMNNDVPFSIDDLRTFFTFSVVKEKLLDLGFNEHLDYFLESLYDYGFRWGMTHEQRLKHHFTHGLSLEEALELFWIKACSKESLTLTQWQAAVKFQQYLGTFVQAFHWINKSEAKGSIMLYDWCNQWKIWLQDLLIIRNPSQGYQKEYERLMRLFNAMKKQAELAHFNHPLSFSLMLSLWQEHTDKKTISTNYSSGKIVFANLLDMHCVPFKFIAVIGLDESYNHAKNQSPLDLSWKLPQPYDRSTEANNNYYFLECLLVARERLWLSYSIDSNQNIINPAVPLGALINYLQSHLHSDSPIHQVVIKEQQKYQLSEQFNLSVKHHNMPVSTLNGEGEKQHIIEYPKVLYCQELSRHLSEPIKTFLQSRGGKLYPQIYPLRRYEDSSPTFLSKASWRIKVMMILLLEESDKHSSLIKQSIDELAAYPGHLSPAIIGEQLEEEARAITEQLMEALPISLCEKVSSPSIYYATDPQADINLCAQAQLVCPPHALADKEKSEYATQIFISGGKMKLQKLLQMWLSHLIYNTFEPQDSMYLSFEQKTDDIKLITKDFKALTIHQAKTKLQEIMSLYSEVIRSPVWAPMNMTYAMHSMLSQGKEEDFHEQQNIRNIFHDLDEGSEWLALLNDYRVYDLSFTNKTWQDSKAYAKRLWVI